MVGATTVGTIGGLIDRAVAEVAEQEFRRLRRGLSDEDIVRNVRRALGEVAKTGDCGKPNYECEWVALFYLTWFQARHINLVYSLLAQRGIKFPQRLHVVDWGCGAMAVQFAVAVYAATSDQAETRLSLTGIDNSRPMIAIGAKLWDRFSKMIREEAGGSPTLEIHRLDGVTKTLSTRMVTDPAMRTEVSELICPDAARRAATDRSNWPPYFVTAWDHLTVDCTHWLTSVHAAYHLPQELREACHRWNLHGILLTAHKCRAPGLDSVVKDMSYQFGGIKVQPRNEGRLRQTTKWRHQLRRRLRRRHPLLDRAVEWNPPHNPIEKDDVRAWGMFQ